MFAQKLVRSLEFVVRRKSLLIFLIFIYLLLTTNYLLPTVQADEIEDLQKQIDELNHARELSVNATKPLEGQLDSLKRQLAQIQASLDNLSASISQKQKDLSAREDKIALQQALLETRVRAYYIRSFLTDPLVVIFSSVQAGDLFRELSYRQSVTREDKSIISSITAEVVDLLTQKTKLEKDKARLAVLQADVDKNASFLGGEIKKAKAYQADLNKQIASLSQRQQELLAAKLASLNISRSAAAMGRCDSDLTNGRDPGFTPKFAVFTYGVPNRVGLNQWGAYGRAQAGQGYDQILRTYYNFDNYQNFDNSIHINVNGYGSFSLEDYVKRIYEVPGDWPAEALKAQAIAARSYALAYTNSGSGSICASESCQVFKPDPKGGAWEQAVNDTVGKAMIQGGRPIKAWFSSTHGGYVFSSASIGWGGTAWTKDAVDVAGSISSFSDLGSSSYDRASPWFYCDWGSRSDYNKTAWLKPEELADIINVILLGKTDSSTQTHLAQLDRSNPDGTDTWDAGRVRQELQNRGIHAFNAISSASVGWDTGGGRTTSVNISGDGGSTNINATDFKNFFNLRAPANIQIVGPLFNVEKR